ncbi:MAG: YihA family ribosome biogenesis GTP-binding protein [Alphaproteobacteria bacterium]|nr:MAG: YihA family ribosome biogenesis GTP-binding protein [Alphaproteobacteria bacterium]
MSDPSNEGIDLEAGRLLFAGQCTFMLGIKALAALPEPHLPELAFAGRSNVGKSSLINALTNRKTLARTSNTPGRTREINFFNLADRLVLVDLPGYGYARVSKAEAKVWSSLVLDYLRERTELRRVVVLIDARRGIMAADQQVMALFDEAAVSYQVVLTKTDKIRPTDLGDILADVAQRLSKRVAAYPQILATSSVKGVGLPELRAALAALANG